MTASLKSLSQMLPKMPFFRRFSRNLLFGGVAISGSLGLGLAGYRHFESMDWIDSYLNASMILSGMGPVGELKTSGGKLFSGTYALFSGTLFLVVIAIVFGPIVHRYFHQFHLEE